MSKQKPWSLRTKVVVGVVLLLAWAAVTAGLGGDGWSLSVFTETIATVVVLGGLVLGALWLVFRRRNQEDL